jgi:hypothetical protein
LGACSHFIIKTCRKDAVRDKRDVKKTLQKLGRQRPDVIFLLPEDHLLVLARGGPPPNQRTERKVVSASERLHASFVAGTAGKGQGASFQDVLRLCWVWSTTGTGDDAINAVLPGEWD